MSLLQEITSMIGGPNLQRLAGGQGNFADPASPDHASLQQLIARAQPAQLQSIFGQAAQQLPADQYAQHMSPSGSGAGTNPLGGLAGPALGTIASLLVSHLMYSAGYNASSLLSSVPGLQTTNPNQMDPNQVAALAQFAQQNHPQVFGNVAAQIGQQQPGLLNSFLGKAGLAIGAAALASHFVKMG